MCLGDADLARRQVPASWFRELDGRFTPRSPVNRAQSSTIELEPAHFIFPIVSVSLDSTRIIPGLLTVYTDRVCADLHNGLVFIGRYGCEEDLRRRL